MSHETPVLLAAVLGCALGAAPAYAGKPPETLTYWFTGAAEEHTLFHFVDASTITYDGPARSAWLTVVAAGNAEAKYGWRRKMTLMVFDCARKSSLESRVVEYDRSATSLLDHAYDNDQFHQVSSNGPDATELEFVCANPGDWPSGKNWAKIAVTPEAKSDQDNKAFQTHHTP